MEQVSRDFPPQPLQGGTYQNKLKCLDSSLCNTLHTCPKICHIEDVCLTLHMSVDLDLGLSLWEICAVYRSDEKQFPAAFKCYHYFHKIGSVSSDNLFFKMVIHIHSDSVFQRYQKEMRNKPGLRPIYQGNYSNGTLAKDDLADEDANLMIKLKFLTYKILLHIPL
ncbi:tRNA ligase 1 [Camellia lanceoleosa]|uniref:tRNA ligase 1 n=1 Tax=Camellia lanceoleosa TaxID=1840588 RepID=A0ACC0H9R7_9ERIC|nr:tRNA ligase 1 [Camellia lanceoleosa]